MRQQNDGDPDYFFRRLGLVRTGHHLAHGRDHGFGQWLPAWAKHWIALLWNRISCALFGHNDYGPIESQILTFPDGSRVRIPYSPRTCSACCKTWPDNRAELRAAPPSLPSQASPRETEEETP